jgi:hypothetical protein
VQTETSLFPIESSGGFIGYEDESIPLIIGGRLCEPQARTLTVEKLSEVILRSHFVL